MNAAGDVRLEIGKYVSRFLPGDRKCVSRFLSGDRKVCQSLPAWI